MRMTYAAMYIDRDRDRDADIDIDVDVDANIDINIDTNMDKYVNVDIDKVTSTCIQRKCDRYRYGYGDRCTYRHAYRLHIV